MRSFPKGLQDRGETVGIRRARFLQHDPDGGVHAYTCLWKVKSPTGSRRATQKYLSECFSDPQRLSSQFTADKLRCHSLASAVRVTPYVARRFARTAPLICYVNHRRGKKILPEGLKGFPLEGLLAPFRGLDHLSMQLKVLRLGAFAALEISLFSPTTTGHLDCLLSEEEMLYALEVNSYPSDFTDPWAGTPPSRLFGNLVQSLAYGELLSLATGLTRIGVGMLHSDGLILLDATDWLLSDRTLLRAVEDWMTRFGPKHRTSRPYP